MILEPVPWSAVSAPCCPSFGSAAASAFEPGQVQFVVGYPRRLCAGGSHRALVEVDSFYPGGCCQLFELVKAPDACGVVPRLGFSMAHGISNSMHMLAVSADLDAR